LDEVKINFYKILNPGVFLGKIIAIANQKGGVGKTTTAVNLSASLVRHGKKILLIDFDPQGSTSVGLDKRVENEEIDIYRALIGQKKLQDIILKTEVDNLFIIPTGNNLSGAEIELVSAFSREGKLKNILLPIIDKYDYIIIDCPPSLGLLTINALNAAHSVLIPLQCEYYAMEGLSQLLTTIDLVKRSLNPSLCIEGILLTMFDKRNKLSQQVVEEIRHHFGEAVFNTIIPRNVRLSESPSHGKAAICYDPASSGARAYIDLSDEFVEREDINLTDNEEITNSAIENLDEKISGVLPASLDDNSNVSLTV